MFKGQNFGIPLLPELPDLPQLPEFPRAVRGFKPTVFYPRELSHNYQHIREKPEPIRAVQARKSARMRAEFRTKQGWPPCVKDDAQHKPRALANSQYKPP